MKLIYLLSLLLPAYLLFAENSKTAREVVISGNDAMQFNLKEFSATPGETISLCFKNIGSMPKIAMGHNLVILNKGISALSFGQKVLASGGNSTNPLPSSLLNDVLAHTKLLGPDESDTITFVVPAEKGDYDYVCTFPGHFAMMRGKMIVK